MRRFGWKMTTANDELLEFNVEQRTMIRSLKHHKNTSFSAKSLEV